MNGGEVAEGERLRPGEFIPLVEGRVKQPVNLGCWGRFGVVVVETAAGASSGHFADVATREAEETYVNPASAQAGARAARLAPSP